MIALEGVIRDSAVKTPMPVRRSYQSNHRSLTAHMSPDFPAKGDVPCYGAVV